MERIKTDICIIGAGSGGLSVAAGAAQMGARVVLIEEGEMGGDCLNHGCVPSKALLAASARVPRPTYAEAMAHVKASIAAIAPHDSQERFESLGVRVIRARGEFVGPRRVRAANTEIKARRFVVATGSRPMIPQIEGLSETPFLTNETLFDLKDRPEHLIVIGAGPIGLELAQAHRRLGSRVTVIEAAKALGREEPELAAIVVDRLRQDGVEILENTKVLEAGGKAGAVWVETGAGRIEGSHLLAAAGRAPNVQSLGLEAAGIAFDPFAGVKVEPNLKTSGNRRVYAIGDVAGRRHFTHLAGYQAGIVVRSAVLGLPARERQDHIPRATYTSPEIAHVGLTEAEARAKFGDGIEVVQVGFDKSDRAVTAGDTEGAIKVIVRKGKPIGAGIVGHEAGELIAMWAMAISSSLGMAAISNTVLPYPTRAEINKRAASAYFSPRLFESRMIKRITRLVQRWLP
jgi:pyruvate/2-oxoglutarate dehydrogenase complex dihydrolipoamide dehydrogenase (E3) component